jgi:hypothetical protein
MPAPMPREVAAAYAAQDLAAYAAIRAWMAADVGAANLLMEQYHIPPESAHWVMALIRAASRALLSAEGYHVESALAVLDQWLEDAGNRASA